MRFIACLLLTTILAFALGLYFDWWSIAIAAFVVSLCIPQRPLFAFFSGGIGIGLLWGGYSFFLNHRNNGLLAGKIADVLPLHGNVLLLMLITTFIGGLVGGLAALSASYLRRAPDDKITVVKSENVYVQEEV